MDYKLMCFPCLRKKKKLSSFGSSSTDIDERFEYIVDKYTIRKIPLYPVITPDEVSQRQTQELDTKFSSLHDQPVEEKDIGDFTKISMIPDAYSLPRVTPVLPVTTHSSRSVKEKPRPADILDSTSQVPRRPVMKPNYVVIPSKASLHAKDIMMTKREITNQYLNNFSSVFVDNLKDQVPKDPENLPKLSRPYTSAVKNICVGNNIPKSSRRRSDSCRSKVQKLIYSLPDGNIVETGYDLEEGEYSTQTTDDETLVPVHSSDNREKTETVSIPFKGVLKEQSSLSDTGVSQPSRPQSSQQTETSPSSKQITYEDIQALDVGYEFPNGEKYGVKPKMTRIRITNLDIERSKETNRPGHVSLIDTEPRRQADGGAVKTERTRSQSQTSTLKPQNYRGEMPQGNATPPTREDVDEYQRTSRYFLADTCFVPHSMNLGVKINRPAFAEYSRDEAEKNSERENEQGNTLGEMNNKAGSDVKTETDYLASSVELNEKFSGSFLFPKLAKPCMKSMTRPSSVSSERSGTYTSSSVRQKAGTFPHGGNIDTSISHKTAMLCRSRSFESFSSIKKDEQGQNATKAPHFLRFGGKRIEEPETETTNSLYSRDSKTSSLVTSPVTSELEVGKKATLRWKIIIKHHKDEPKDGKVALASLNQ